MANLPVIESHGPELALWSCPPTNTAVESVNWIEYRPVSQITNGSTIEFNIPGTGNHYFDLQKTRMKVTLKVINSNGKDLTDTDKVGLINLPQAAIFSQVDVSVQKKTITKTTPPNYAYKAYIDTILNTTDQVKQTYLTNGLFYWDSAKQMDGTPDVAESKSNDDAAVEVADKVINTGLTYRTSKTSLSSSLTLEGGVYVDFFQTCDRYVMNGISIALKFWQTPDSFRLMAANANKAYKVDITDMSVFMCGVSVNPQVTMAHNNALKKSPALYPYISSDFKVYSIPKGEFTYSAEDLYQGSVPSKLYVCFVDASAYNGSYDKNPFNFQHVNLNYLSFCVDGRSIPTDPFTPDFTNSQFADSYLSMFKSNGMLHSNTSNGITRERYEGGYAIWVIDVHNQTDNNALPLQQRGHTRLQVKFAQGLKKSTNMIVYAKFPAALKVDGARGVYV